MVSSVRSLYVFAEPVLTRSLAASQVAQQMAQSQMGQNPMGGAEDPDKQFKAEIENLEVIEHNYILDGVEERLLAKVGR